MFIANRRIPSLPPKFAFLLTAVMVFVAYLLDDGVFLLPAFAPLAYGAFAGTGCWACGRNVFVAVLGLSALAGVVAVRVGGGEHLWGCMLAVCLVVSGLLGLSRSRLFPAYAVAVLPVYLGEGRFTYVLVVLAMALLLVCLCLFPRNGRPLSVADGRGRVLPLVMPVVVMCPLFFLSALFANAYFLVPALWYVCAEFFGGRVGGPVLPRLTQLLFAVVLGALADKAAMSLLQFFSLADTGVVPALVYAVSVLLALLLFYRLAGRRLFLPALAFVVFPFLRDGESAYVLAADCSLLYMLLAACVAHRFLRGAPKNR